MELSCQKIKKFLASYFYYILGNGTFFPQDFFSSKFLIFRDMQLSIPKTKTFQEGTL